MHHHSTPPTSQNPAGTVLTIVRLASEGRLAPGDVVSTDVLGPCDVLGIVGKDGLRVRTQSCGREVLIGGIAFPPGAVFESRHADPRDGLRRS